MHTSLSVKMITYLIYRKTNWSLCLILLATQALGWSSMWVDQSKLGDIFSNNVCSVCNINHITRWIKWITSLLHKVWININVHKVSKNISNPIKAQTPNMSLKGIFSNGFSKGISHHPASGDMFEDHLSLCNSKTDLVIMNLYVLTFAMRIFSISQGCHTMTIHLYIFICKRCHP